MKRALVVSVVLLLVVGGMPIALASSRTDSATLASVIPPVTPDVIPTQAFFTPLPVDTMFMATVRTSATWTSVEDNTLINLGHAVALMFQANGGVFKCNHVSQTLWGVAASTNKCRDAKSATVLYLDKVSVDDNLALTHSGAIAFVDAATAVYTLP